MLRVNLKYYDRFIRTFDRTNKDIEEALYEGTTEGAEYLRERIEDKFGKYQNTGGKGNGPWQRLKYPTIAKKRRKGNGGNATKPLVDYGDMMFSFDIMTSNRTRKHTATITSNDDKILYHIYGVPSSNVPRRDPVRPTFEEERQNVFDIVAEAVRRKLNGDS